MEPRIILIGGAPGTGKSTIALEAAYKLRIKQIVDADVIRETLRGERKKENHPYLFYSSCSAWQHEGDESNQNVINSFLKYSKELNSSIKKVIDRAGVLGKDAIIEGVHMVPSMFSEYSKHERLYPFLVSIEDEYKHKQNFLEREEEFNGRSIDRFLQNFGKTRLINDYLTHDARSNGYNIISANSLEDSVDRIIEVVK